MRTIEKIVEEFNIKYKSAYKQKSPFTWELLRSIFWDISFYNIQWNTYYIRIGTEINWDPKEVRKEILLELEKNFPRLDCLTKEWTAGYFIEFNL